MKFSHLFFSNQPDVKWALVRQMGVKYAIAKLAPELTGQLPPWDFDSLKTSKEVFEEHGFNLIGLEGDQMDMHRIKLGLTGRDEDIDRYCQMLENMGKLNIKLLCYNFMVTGWYRTQLDQQERGGALVTAFDYEQAQHSPNPLGVAISAEQVFDNYSYFIERVMPVAEQAGVKMGLHPDDPPVSSLQGIGRAFTNASEIRRALAISDSPSHGLTFCQGTYTTMQEDIEALAREWIPRIFFLHLRDVVGSPNRFHETFHDNGPTDMVSRLALYREIGYDGPVRSDHVPTMAGETNQRPGYGMHGNLFGIGYLKGIMEALAIDFT